MCCNIFSQVNLKVSLNTVSNKCPQIWSLWVHLINQFYYVTRKAQAKQVIYLVTYTQKTLVHDL